MSSASPPAPDDLDPLLGRVIAGRFQILELVARGGMGRVYKALQSPLGRVCALKVLSPTYRGDGNPEFARRFLLEAAAAARLSHPNTVTIFDYGQDGELYFIAMEYLDGLTLFRTLRAAGGPLGETRANRIAQQVCRSLREAHGLGLVHRDLKPGNIVLRDHGDEHDIVKVLDFGLVKDVTGSSEDLTEQGMFMGSPRYMAPEQVTGDAVSARTDVYSLGVVLFEMLTGVVPFGGTGMATLMAHVHNPPPLVCDVLPPGAVVSEAMQAVVARCLAKDPADRFADMKELLHALKLAAGEQGSFAETHEQPLAAKTAAPLASGASVSEPAPSASIVRPVAGVPPSDAPSAAPPARGHPWLYVGAALASAAVVLVAAKALSRPAPPPAPASSASVPAAPSPAAGVPSAAGASSAAASATSSAVPAPALAGLLAVRVESDPAGASVSEEGVEKCGATPCEVVWRGADAQRPHTLSVKKQGFRSGSVDVAPGASAVAVTLKAAPAAPPPPPPPAVPSGYKRSPYD